MLSALALRVCDSDRCYPALHLFRPSRRQFSAFRRVVVLARIRNAFIEHHRDVAAERRLNFHCDLRRNERPGAVDVILEFHAVLGDFAQLHERENLIPAAVGENRPIPTHEIVQAAKMLDDVESRPNEQVVGVSQNNLRIQLAEFARTDALHAALCSHRHKRGRIDHAMRSF